MHQAMTWMTAQLSDKPTPWAHEAVIEISKAACDNWQKAQQELKQMLDIFVVASEMIT